MLCVIFGIPGVGKTTVLNEVAKIVDIKRINFGDVMFKEAKSRGLADARDEMRKLPTHIQTDLQQKAAERIHSEAKAGGNIIVDTHASVRTSRGYLPGLPEPVRMALDPDALVLIECDSKDILGRRNKDQSRQRDADALSEIEEHQLIDRIYVAIYSDLTNCTLLIVKNKEGKVKEAGEKISLIFKK